MISSACTSRKRSPTLIASRSRRLWRSATSWTIFSSWSLIDAGPGPPSDPCRPAAAARSSGDLEPRLVDRLQQVVDRVDLERLDRVLIVGGDEDDVRRRLRVDHAPRHLETGQPRHLDVEEHDVGLQSLDRAQRLDAVAGLPDHLDAADLAEQIAQLVPRELLVVDQDAPANPSLRRHPLGQPESPESRRWRRYPGRARSSARRW